MAFETKEQYEARMNVFINKVIDLIKNHQWKYNQKYTFEKLSYIEENKEKIYIYRMDYPFIRKKLKKLGFKVKFEKDPFGDTVNSMEDDHIIIYNPNYPSLWKNYFLNCPSRPLGRLLKIFYRKS